MMRLPVLRSRRSDERGIVLVWFALCLTVMLLASAFAVDVGAWYKRSQELQRAVDAAALAASSYLPAAVPSDLTNAQSAALASLKANGINYGYANGVAQAGGDSNISVTVGVVSTNAKQFQVSVTDGAVTQYFSKLAFNGMHESRTAIAEHTPSAPMGSPLNTFGIGSLAGNSSHNIWASVSGWCTAKEDGDRYMTRYDGTYSAGPPQSWACPNPYSSPSSPGVTNTDYDGFGYHYYDYVIDVPSGRSTGVQVNAYDPYYIPFYVNGFGSSVACSGSIDIFKTNTTYNITTHFDLYMPDNTTLVQANTFASKEDGFGGASHGNCALSQTWATLTPTGGLTTAGKYHLRVYTEANQSNSSGVNNYGLEAISVGGAHTPSSQCARNAVTGYTASATCPIIYGKDAISVYANGTKTSGGDFYLAQVDSSHKGGTMTISLWDPGDPTSSGTRYLQVLDNNNNSVAFTYSVSPCTSGCSGSVTAGGNGLDLSGNTGSVPGYLGTATYNDKLVTLTVQIPSTYSDTANSGWWKINYNIPTGAATVADTTTWSVKVNGNPIHLVKGG